MKSGPPTVPLRAGSAHAALQRLHWRKRLRLSSVADSADRFLARAAMDRGPWLVVAFAAGIAAWFVLPGPSQWGAAGALSLILVLGALALWRGREGRVHLLTAVLALSVMFAAGLAIIWARSVTVGTPAIDRPMLTRIDGRILERIEQPAHDRTRLILAARIEGEQRALKLRINVPEGADSPGLTEGSVVSMRARLLPPAPPMLPGGYNFARFAWFEGLAATGTALGEIAILDRAPPRHGLARWQRALSQHVRSRIEGSAGSIAAAFASGDRGAISGEDEEAMRDAGLTHLLSISGLHVSAVIAATYVLSIRMLALWPALALRVRLPLVAAGIAALAGIGYTLLTGAQVPTIRSCVGAVLVLIALALGREPLSLRMVACAAMVILLLWPETLIGPSFQMSFSAVIAIVALHGSSLARAFLAPREEGMLAWLARRGLALLVTGLVIEIALMPIVLFHFHRAGVYGALANVVAIPLVTFVSMPLIALALALDVLGIGAPVWWLAGKSLDLLLGIAHLTAGQPGAVKLMPQMSQLTFALFVGGALWLALWRGRARLMGLAPAGIATLLLVSTPRPDLLVTGDGRHVGLHVGGGQLLVLRDTRSDYVRDNLQQLAGLASEPVALDRSPQARCGPDFCTIALTRGGRQWHVLMSRSRDLVTERALAAACDRADIVISDRRLPRSCRPRWLKADRRMLSRTGGLAIVLEDRTVTTVAQGQGGHGWWRTN